jgi:hypothetical protein
MNQSGGSATVTNSTLSNNTASGIAFGGGGIANYGTFTVTDTLITENRSTSGIGGGITNYGTLVVTNSTLSNNSAAGNAYGGGGIDNATMLTMDNSTVTGNTATGDYGGGISTGGTAVITDSTISGNTAANGGGVFDHDGSLTITGSLLSGNSANYGGGLYNGSTSSVMNSTLSGNSGSVEGGGISTNTGTSTMVTNSTLAGNSAGIGGDGIANGGTVTLGAAILADGSAGGDCTGVTGNLTDLGYNQGQDSSCGFIASTDLANTPAGLDSAGLQNNGGPTQTIALEPGSPAIDHVIGASLCPTTDQRGDPRSVPCDIGAYDTDASSLASLHITTASLPDGAFHALYRAPLAATGGNPPYKWSISSGHLPKGLHLKKSTGIIKGKPNKHDSGTYTFTVKVVDKKIKVKHQPPTQDTATKVLSITIS